MIKRPFSTKWQRVTQPLELVHSDVCGPLNVQAREGYKYYALSLTAFQDTLSHN